MNAILALLLLLAGAVWLWYENLGARESARAVARLACRKAGVQFLDDTVRLAWMRPARGPSGRITLARLYAFEFSPDGTGRQPGHVKLSGRRVEWLELEGLEMADGQTRP